MICSCLLLLKNYLPRASPLWWLHCADGLRPVQRSTPQRKAAGDCRLAILIVFTRRGEYVQDNSWFVSRCRVRRIAGNDIGLARREYQQFLANSQFQGAFQHNPRLLIRMIVQWYIATGRKGDLADHSLFTVRQRLAMNAGKHLYRIYVGGIRTHQPACSPTHCALGIENQRPLIGIPVNRSKSVFPRQVTLSFSGVNATMGMSACLLSSLSVARSVLLAQLANPAIFLGLLLALVVGISVHEFSHAWMANRLGDPTAESQGRLTLNPLSHLDLMGTIMIFLIGFGWGKPVPYNPANLRNGPISGGAMVAIAGPAANIVTAAVLGLLFRNLITFSGASVDGTTEAIATILAIVVQINIALAIFNIIPIPPLDGYRVLLRFLPPHVVPSITRLELQGPFLLLLIVLLDQWFLRIGIFNAILGPPVFFLRGLFLGV